MKKTAGIHHITAIVGHPQENVDFYASVLGLRLVKKTINFDDPGTYHLYFGNDSGKPGTIITFFPWADGRKGKIGDGQVEVTAYIIPQGSIDFWEKRLAKFNIEYHKTSRFNDTYLELEDPHGLKIALVEREQGETNAWSFGNITSDVAIKGFDGAVLQSSHPEATVQLLEDHMGFEKIGEEGDYVRLKSYGEIGNTIDIKLTSIGYGIMGVGTVHHIAWRAKDDADQLDWKEAIEQAGYQVTEVRDRNYFNAIYFREQGSILFEIATDPPGFAHDESYETMGEKLMLPSQYEPFREQLNQRLIPIKINDRDS